MEFFSKTFAWPSTAIHLPLSPWARCCLFLSRAASRLPLSLYTRCSADARSEEGAGYPRARKNVRVISRYMVSSIMVSFGVSCESRRQVIDLTPAFLGRIQTFRIFVRRVCLSLVDSRRKVEVSSYGCRRRCRLRLCFPRWSGYDDQHSLGGFS